MRPDNLQEWLAAKPIGEVINDTFLPIKTPLHPGFAVPNDMKFTPNMFVNQVRDLNIAVGLVINLTFTDKYYNLRELEVHGFKTEHIYCKGHSGPPMTHCCEKFVRICKNFLSDNPNKIIAVHCTHGRNRTGYMICYYLCKVHDWSAHQAMACFAEKRPPGILKEDYRLKLETEFGRRENSINFSQTYAFAQKSEYREREMSQSWRLNKGPS